MRMKDLNNGEQAVDMEDIGPGKQRVKQDRFPLRLSSQLVVSLMAGSACPLPNSLKWESSGLDS